MVLMRGPEQGQFSGVEATHSMDPASWRCGCRTEIEAGGASGVAADLRTEEELANGHGASADVAPHEVGIHGFEVCRGGDAAGKNAVAKTRRVALDLGLD